MAGDGILIDKTPPSQGTVTDDGAWTASTSTLHCAILDYRLRSGVRDRAVSVDGDTIRVNVSAVDPDGDALQYQFLLDGSVQQAWGVTPSWNWNTAGIVREHPITVQVRDVHGRQTDKNLRVFGYRKARGRL